MIKAYCLDGDDGRNWNSIFETEYKAFMGSNAQRIQVYKAPLLAHLTTLKGQNDDTARRTGRLSSMIVHEFARLCVLLVEKEEIRRA